MFKNLYELISKMPTEQACRDYLAAQRWADGKAICPFCDCDRCYTILGGKRYKCSNKECKKQFSVTVGTVFECSNIPLSKWFIGVFLATGHKKGISSHQLARDLGITQKSAWFMLHRIREITGCKVATKLNGVVEIDESFIGGNITNKHKSVRLELNKMGDSPQVHKVGIMGLLEREGNIKLKVLQTSRYDGITLKPIIRDNVNTDATIVTDGFGAYKGLDKEFKGHEIIQHSQNEFVRGDFHTNNLEGFWSLMKRGIYGIYHSVSPKHLQSYCNEFSYRYNTRDLKDADRFTLSLRNVSGRLSHKALIAR